MLQLHYSNRLENLIDPLATAVDENQRRDPLADIPIIVPNRSVEQFVKYAIAERLGVAANLSFPFLRQYLRRIAERADETIRVLELPRLQVLLFECLRSDAMKGDTALRAVRDYLDQSNADPRAATAELRMFELVGRVAQFFQEYSISRAAMIARWNSASFDGGNGETETWQRKLWTTTFDRDCAARREWTRDPNHRWMLLLHALEALTDDDLREVLPERIHVFGLASPGRAFVEAFARIGRLTDLRIYALNPCMEFWEDLETSLPARRELWRRRSDRVGKALDQEEDSFKLASPADNRALQLWARPGREYIRMLNELTECDFHPHFSHNIKDDGINSVPTVLARLQQDVLVRAVEGENGMVDEEPIPQSIRFSGAPGARRELEIVANEILRLTDGADDREKPATRLHQIAVMMPEAATELYLPQVRAVFTSQFGIPIDVAGKNAGQSSVGEAIDLLLALPLSRLTRDDLLRLATHPAINRGKVAEPLEISRVTKWCEELGVFFGADSADLSDTYVPANLFQWDQALSRIALGAFMHGGLGTDVSEYPSEEGPLMPFSMAEDDREDALRLLTTVRSLIADARTIRDQSLPLADWAQAMREMVGRYLEVSNASDLAVRDRCLEILEEMTSLPGEPVSYAVAHGFVSSALANLSTHHGAFSGRGVAVGSLEALRGLPFRAIFAIGLGEEVFPESDRRDPLDLRVARRHSGDIGPRERDRYLFLETILAAQESLTFSWVERDAQTGDAREPSTAIRELQMILGEYLGEKNLKALTTSHRLSQYDPSYFPEIEHALGLSESAPAGQVSYDPEARRGARMRAMRIALERAVRPLTLPERCALMESLAPELIRRIANSLSSFELPAGPRAHAGAARVRDDNNAIELPLAAIRRFLECPLQGAARYALGMVQDDDLDEDASEEPLALSRVDHAVLLRDVFWAVRRDPDAFADVYRRALTVAQMSGRAPAGPFAKAAIDADCERFARWYGELAAAGISDLARWRSIRVGRGDERSRSDVILSPITLELPSTMDRVARRVNLYGSIGYVSPKFDCSMRMIARWKARARDFLDPFLAAIALSAAEQPIPDEFTAIVIGDPPKTGRRNLLWRRTFCPPEPRAAREYLASLIVEMLSGPHDYFLPIEAVAKSCEALGKGNDPLDAIENLREVDFISCASDFGPVRRARDYEPPDEAEIAGMVERRFGPIKDIFDEQDDA